MFEKGTLGFKGFRSRIFNPGFGIILRAFLAIIEQNERVFIKHVLFEKRTHGLKGFSWN